MPESMIEGPSWATCTFEPTPTAVSGAHHVLDPHMLILTPLGLAPSSRLPPTSPGPRQTENESTPRLVSSGFCPPPAVSSRRVRPMMPSKLPEEYPLSACCWINMRSTPCVVRPARLAESFASRAMMLPEP